MEEIKKQNIEENISLEEKNEEEIEIKKEKKSNITDDHFEIEKFENINSPQKIQHILQASTSKIKFELENNIIESLLSINNTIINILDNDIDHNLFNPYIIAQNKKNNLYKLNFEEVNITNNFLNKKIKQYNELKEKISEYNKKKSKKPENLNNAEKTEKKEENTVKINEKITKNLFFIEHPLIKTFEEEKKINIKELKNEINNEYLKKMKDNTKYEHIQKNAQDENENNNDNDIDNEDNEDNEDNDDNDDNDNDNEDNEDDDNESYISLNSLDNNENVNNIPNMAYLNPVIELVNINQNNNNSAQQIIEINNPNDLNNNQNNMNEQNNVNDQNAQN